MGEPKDVVQAGDAQVKAEPADADVVQIETDQQEQTVGKLTDSDIMAALNNKLGNLLNNAFTTLPKSVKRNVKALKKLQLEHVNVEVEFFKELHELEIKYEKLFEPLYEKRSQIINAVIIPTDEECDYASDSEKESELSNEIQKVKIGDGTDAKTEESGAGDKKASNETEQPEIDVKGIPEFWLVALKNAPSIAEMIEEYDEPILRELFDIKATTVSDPMSFVLHFHFKPNDYFTNTVLTKSYELRCTPDPTDVFSFEGPEIVKCKGCVIDWKKGKNVTVKTIKKKQKHKARGAVRTVTKTVQNDSFFNFFNPPAVPQDEAEMDEETQNILSNDYEVGNLIKDRLIPHAVLFFTGENVIDDEFEEEEDEEDEDDDFDGDEDEEEEDDDDDNKNVRRKKQNQKMEIPQQPPECKQQ